MSDKVSRQHESTKSSTRAENVHHDRPVTTKNNEERLRSVFAASPDAIIVADLKGNIIECNEAALGIYGFSKKKELMGRSGFDFIAEADRARAAENFKHILEVGCVRNREYRLLNRAGHEYWGEISGSVVRDGSGKPVSFVGIIKDITLRKRAEEALLESERKYRSVVDNIAVGVSVIGPEMEVLAFNKQMQCWFPNVDVSERPVCYKVLINPPRQDICPHCPTLKTLKDGQTHEWITDTVSGDRVVSFRIKSSPMKDKDGRVIAAIRMVDDVTEHRKLEQALKLNSERLEELVKERTLQLQKSEEEFRLAFENANDAMIWADAETGLIINCNRAAETLFGKDRGQIIGMHQTTLHPSSKAGYYAEMFGRHIAQEKAVNEEIEVITESREIKPVHLSASVTSIGQKRVIQGIFRDITEKKKAETALHESEQKLRSLFENVPDGIYRSSPKGRILDANPALARMLGYSSLDELRAVDIPRDLYFDQMERTAWKQKLEAEGELRNAELVLRRKNGQKLVVLENTHVVRDNSNRTMYYEGTITDITERKALEETLSALNLYGSRVNAAESIDEVYELTLNVMERTLGFGHASFATIQGGYLLFKHQRGYATPLDFRLPLDGSKGGITVRAAAKCESTLVADTTKDPDYVMGSIGTPSAKSELAVPVVAENEVLGVLNVESKESKAFSQKDVVLLEALASHAATAIVNIKRRDELERRTAQQASLMKSSAEMIHSSELRQRLQAILDAIKGLGWRRVVLSVRDENVDIGRAEDIVTAGLTEEEREFLWTNRQSGQTWRERMGPDFQRFRIGEFYYLPWSDPWVRQKFSKGTVSSHLKPEEMIDWNPDDLLYAPLRLADGRIVGVVSIDDPVDGRRPTGESLTPLELFLHQAAVAIENARLIGQLEGARREIRQYADELEVKVDERTRELVEAQTRLLRTERLAAIGELAGMIGHDLRNPLTGIAGAAYYLRSKYASEFDKRGKEMLQIIENDIEYSNKIINDLLEYSREVKLELTTTNPETMLADALSQVKIPRSIRIIDETCNEPRLSVDVKRMRRVFTNLIKNAIDAMPKGGSLRIKSETRKDSVVFTFMDTGAGMNKGTLDRLWTPLFTTKAKGMGFGLPICKRFVEGHGGRICVESKEHQGSTFTVILPVHLKTEDQKDETWVNLPESLASISKTN